MAKDIVAKKVVKSKKVNPLILSFFLIIFPTVIIGYSDNLMVKAALLFYQAILLKQYLDKYYEIF